MNNNSIWQNPNPDGPNLDPHPSECKCINCEIKQPCFCECGAELRENEDFCKDCV